MSGAYSTLDVTAILQANPEAAKLLRPALRGDAPEGIFRASLLPAVTSTSRELACVTDAPIWDVNGYYRAVGVRYPYRVTRRRLREAYQACHGQFDTWATYAFKRLLDPAFRAMYDRRELGQPVHDDYLQLVLNRLAAEWAAEQTALTGEVHTAQDFFGTPEEEPVEAEGQPVAADAAPAELIVDHDWGYGYWLWGSRKRDEPMLSVWQSMLCDVLWTKRLRVPLGVGYVGHRPEPSVRVHYESTDIVFLHENQPPTRELAEKVASTFLTTSPRTPLTEPIYITLNGYEPKTHTLSNTPIIRSAEYFQNNPAEKAYHPSEKEPHRMTGMLDFATGGENAALIAKAEAAARKAKYNRSFLTSHLADDGDSVYGRFLTDEPQWIETKQHAMVPTKSAPKDKPADKNWPSQMSAVCRYTPVGPDRHPAYSDCYICDAMRDSKGKSYFPGTRLWTLLALREPVLGTQEMASRGEIRPEMVGKIVSFRDKTEEVDELVDGKPTGKKTQRKQIVIVNMAQKNFFSPLLTLKSFYQTVLDRDFKIVRKGVKNQQQVQYEFIAMDPVYVKHPESGEPVVFDLRDPKLAAVYEGHGMNLDDLRKYIFEQSSKEHYDRFFDPRVEVSWNRDGDDDDSDDSGSSAPAQSPQQGSATSEPTGGGPTAEQLAELRAQMLASNPPPAEASSDTPVFVAPVS